MALIHGTAHFVSKQSAINYYRPYGFEDVVEAVNEKLAAGEIHIGKPEVPAGGKLILLDGGTRYGIES